MVKKQLNSNASAPVSPVSCFRESQAGHIIASRAQGILQGIASRALSLLPCTSPPILFLFLPVFISPLSCLAASFTIGGEGGGMLLVIHLQFCVFVTFTQDSIGLVQLHCQRHAFSTSEKRQLSWGTFFFFHFGTSTHTNSP